MARPPSSEAYTKQARRGEDEKSMKRQECAEKRGGMGGKEIIKGAGTGIRPRESRYFVRAASLSVMKSERAAGGKSRREKRYDVAPGSQPFSEKRGIV